MPRASETRNVCCSSCHKKLILNEGIKCPRCKTINALTSAFATELVADQWITTCLWKPDGSQASSIVIVKEIWFNISGRFSDIPAGETFPAFHVYNYLDPSVAYSSDSGCRTNPLDQPYTKLEDAINIAEHFAEEALKSGRWVNVADVKEREVKAPEPAPAWLIERIIGKNVRITHTNKRVSDMEGICKGIHRVPGQQHHFDLELEDGSRVGFVPQVVTATTIEGPLRAFAGGRRKIEII